MQLSRVRHTPSGLAHRLAGAALACIGTVAFASAAHAAAVTFNYTGSYTNYTIDPGTYRITVYGAEGGDAYYLGGYGAEASAIYRIGQTLELGIGVGGVAPEHDVAAGGGGASFVDFTIGEPGLGVLLLVGGGGGGGYGFKGFPINGYGGGGKVTPTDPGANGMAGGGGGGGGYSTNGDSHSAGDGGDSLLSDGAPGQIQTPGGFGGGGAGNYNTTDPGTVTGAGGGGGYNGGNAGYTVIKNGQVTNYIQAQGGTSYGNDAPGGCVEGNGPVCFVGGLILEGGHEIAGQGAGNGSVTIEPIVGLAVPEPGTWAFMATGFAALGYAGYRNSRRRARSAL
jgi:hypothetical protein